MHSDSSSPLIVNTPAAHIQIHPSFNALSRLMIPNELMTPSNSEPSHPFNDRSIHVGDMITISPPNKPNIHADLSLPFVDRQAMNYHTRTTQLIPIDGVVIRNDDFICRITLSNVPASFMDENKNLMDTLQLSNTDVRKYCYHRKYSTAEVTKGIYKLPHFDELYQVVRRINPEITEEQFADYVRNHNQIQIIPLVEVADFVIDREGLIKTIILNEQSPTTTHGTLHFHFTADDVEHNLPILQELINRL